PQSSTQQEVATTLLRGLKPLEDMLRELAVAARLPYFQIAGNRGTAAILDIGVPENAALERLHMLFQVRACAFVATKRGTEAAEDLLTGLQLVRLARQIPDAQSATRTQILLVRSLQPLWEGISEGHW